MPSGTEMAKQNVLAFEAWTAARSDADFRRIVIRGVLSRKQIASDCGFSKSVLSQNPRVQLLLEELENDLRSRGVLPPEPMNQERASCVAVSSSDGATTPQLPDSGRLQRLETENASLKAEVDELRRALRRYVSLSDVLAQTGRLPR